MSLVVLEDILEAELKSIDYGVDIKFGIDQILRTMKQMLNEDINKSLANMRLFLEMKCYGKLFEIKYHIVTSTEARIITFEIGLLEEEIKLIKNYVCKYDR